MLIHHIWIELYSTKLHIKFDSLTSYLNNIWPCSKSSPDLVFIESNSNSVWSSNISSAKSFSSSRPLGQPWRQFWPFWQLYRPRLIILLSLIIYAVWLAVGHVWVPRGNSKWHTKFWNYGYCFRRDTLFVMFGFIASPEESFGNMSNYSNLLEYSKTHSVGRKTRARR